MFNVFLILHAILALVLILSVLLQRSDGGALGGLGGGANFSGMLEGRRSADFLTKLTTIIGVLFRGPGWNWVYPWIDGIWFDDLLDWIHFE